MSIMAVLLYAGVTTLTAAIVTLFTAGMAAGSMDRRARKRRYRPLEAAETRRQPEASETSRPLEASVTGQINPSSLEPETPAQAPVQAGAAQGLPAPAAATAAFAVQGTPPPAREKKAAQAERQATPRPAPAAPARRETPAAQALPAPHEATPAAAPDALADLEKLLHDLEMPAGDLAGDAPPEDGGGTLDILAAMGEPEMAMAGLDNELSQIDGGGLPTPAKKASPKARR